MEDLLEFISVQRHDYLNHMQVISGLLQLNKGDKVREYIQKICLGVKKQSQLSHLKPPCLVAVLLVGTMLGSKSQVEMGFNIKSDLSDCEVPAETLCGAVEFALSGLFLLLEKTPLDQRKVEVAITEGEKKYFLKMSIPAAGTLAGEGGTIIGQVEKSLKPFGARVSLTISEEWGDLVLTLPKRPLSAVGG